MFKFSLWLLAFRGQKQRSSFLSLCIFSWCVTVKCCKAAQRDALQRRNWPRTPSFCIIARGTKAPHRVRGELVTRDRKCLFAKSALTCIDRSESMPRCARVYRARLGSLDSHIGSTCPVERIGRRVVIARRHVAENNDAPITGGGVRG